MLTHARQTLSDHDVLRLLNFELSAYEECAQCHFTSVTHTRAPDGSGSNWRGAHLEMDGEMSEAARRITRQVLEEVRDSYDVE